jgi:diguanylate cyclase (GGDEF)-like protein
VQQRLRQLYYRATHDDLTGLLNCRGATDAVNKALTRHAVGGTMSLIGIDQLKLIVAIHGHNSGEAVVASTADAIRRSVGEGDVCARLGEDEFMVFSSEGGVAQARDRANRILAELSRRETALPWVKFTVSIGIADHAGATADFSRMYRDADAALTEARVEGNGCVSVVAVPPASKGSATAAMTPLTSRDFPV